MTEVFNYVIIIRHTFREIKRVVSKPGSGRKKKLSARAKSNLRRNTKNNTNMTSEDLNNLKGAGVKVTKFNITKALHITNLRACRRSKSLF